MKRELKSATVSSSDDWRSGAADILDSIDDVMWDEIREISPPQSPRSLFAAPFELRVTSFDAVSGASPMKDSSFQVNSLNPYSVGAFASKEQESLSPLSGGANFAFGLDTAQLHSVWAATQPEAGTIENFEQNWPVPVSPVPSVCRSSVSETLSETSQLNAADIRRQKNREWKRRSRQKKRQEVDNMRITVARLEKQYIRLSLQSSTSATVNDGADFTFGAASALVPQSKMAAEYTQAVELSKRLGAERLYLKAEIQHKAAWKLNLTRAMQSCLEVDGPRWAQQFQQPALGGEEVLRMQLDTMNEFEAADEFGFHALADLDLTGVILENSRIIARVQSRLLIPSFSDSDFGARTRRMQTFGWDMVQRVHGNIMESVFTKRFRGLNVAELMQKTWANDMRLREFKKVKGETCRLQVLQQVNPNAYVLCRDVMSPTEDISTFRSVFVRFLIETSKKIPASNATSAPTGIDASAPSTPPQCVDSDSDYDEVMLEATGYVLGTQSFDTDYSRNPRPEDIRNKVAWAHLSLSIEFLNVANPVTGDEYQQLRWTARTNYCGPDHAQRNASDMMQGMLRWELLVIAPALNLFSLTME